MDDQGDPVGWVLVVVLFVLITAVIRSIPARPPSEVIW